MEKIDPEHLVRFLIYRSSGHMATTRLHKMAYLAELMGVDLIGSPVTDLTFIRNEYGPWSPPLAQVIEEVEAQGEDIEVSTHEIPTGTTRIFKAKEGTNEVDTGGGPSPVLASLWGTWGYVPTKVMVAYCKGSSLFSRTAPKQVIDIAAYAKARVDAMKRLSQAKQGETVAVPLEGYSWAVLVESEGYSAQCQEFPACITQGDSRSDLESNMREALLSFIEAKVNPSEIAA